MSVARLAPERWARLALTLLLAVYTVACLRAPDEFRLLDNVDLAVHETGHLVFAPLGELLAVLGGTLLQLLVPLAFVAEFARRGDLHAATVPLWWTGQSFWNVARYAADARAQELPLVGGGEHDWFYLLERWDLLAQDVAIGAGLRLTGTALALLALLAGLAFFPGGSRPREAMAESIA